MRRAIIASLLVLLATWGRPVAAETSVPIDLQVDLLRKLVRFERGFVARAGGSVVVLIVTRASDPVSVRVVAQMREAFSRINDIAGRPIRLVTEEYTSPKLLRTKVDAENASLVIVPPGLAGELGAIAPAFAGRTSITMTTDGDQVSSGAVVGFELVSSKPKIVLNLGQARRQHLDFDSDLFRLCKVIE